MNLTHDLQNLTGRIDRWAIRHHPYVIEMLRMGFGVFLAVRGFSLTLNKTALDIIEQNSQLFWMTKGLLQTLNVIMIIGGLCIAIGLYTRFWSLVLIPITVITMLQANMLSAAFDDTRIISIGLFSLVLLIFFAFYGSGLLSLDYFRRRR